MNVTLKTTAEKSNCFFILPTIVVGREKNTTTITMAWLIGFIEIEVINNK